MNNKFLVAGLRRCGFKPIGTNMMTLQGYLLDIVATIVINGVVGGVVGWWLGRK